MTKPDDKLVEDRADWLLDAVASATQDRRFLRGDPEYDAVTGEAILLNGAKAIRTALQSQRASMEGEIVELRAAATAAGSALDNWIKIIGIRAPLNPDLKHYFWQRNPTWDEAQEAMRVNNELRAALNRELPEPQGTHDA